MSGWGSKYLENFNKFDTVEKSLFLGEKTFEERRALIKSLKQKRINDIKECFSMDNVAKIPTLPGEASIVSLGLTVNVSLQVDRQRDEKLNRVEDDLWSIFKVNFFKSDTIELIPTREQNKLVYRIEPIESTDKEFNDNMNLLLKDVKYVNALFYTGYPLQNIVAFINNLYKNNRVKDGYKDLSNNRIDLVGICLETNHISYSTKRDVLPNITNNVSYKYMPDYNIERQVLTKIKPLKPKAKEEKLFLDCCAEKSFDEICKMGVSFEKIAYLLEIHLGLDIVYLRFDKDKSVHDFVTQEDIDLFGISKKELKKLIA